MKVDATQYFALAEEGCLVSLRRIVDLRPRFEIGLLEEGRCIHVLCDGNGRRIGPKDEVAYETEPQEEALNRVLVGLPSATAIDQQTYLKAIKPLPEAELRQSMAALLFGGIQQPAHLQEVEAMMRLLGSVACRFDGLGNLRYRLTGQHESVRILDQGHYLILDEGEISMVIFMNGREASKELSIWFEPSMCRGGLAVRPHGFTAQLIQNGFSESPESTHSGRDSFAFSRINPYQEFLFAPCTLPCLTPIPGSERDAFLRVLCEQLRQMKAVIVGKRVDEEGGKPIFVFAARATSDPLSFFVTSNESSLGTHGPLLVRDTPQGFEFEAKLPEFLDSLIPELSFGDIRLFDDQSKIAQSLRDHLIRFEQLRWAPDLDERFIEVLGMLADPLNSGVRFEDLPGLLDQKPTVPLTDELLDELGRALSEPIEVREHLQLRRDTESLQVTISSVKEEDSSLSLVIDVKVVAESGFKWADVDSMTAAAIPQSSDREPLVGGVSDSWGRLIVNGARSGETYRIALANFS